MLITDLVNHCSTRLGYSSSKDKDELGSYYLDLLVEFFNDAAVDKHTAAVITDEAVCINLDLTLFQQQLQFEVSEESMPLRPHADKSTNSLSPT